ncbi:unnamed protein product [Fraxinus pennsylvanica]|uniref:Wall-associated receptor kinase galacturonan-binding domain-containing protein n=1 Tax=Fraxinus pennsylvanica TaxID=56036 RepID=A0AAD1ZDZ1_9LAMI|nr:unnamed protein product [Fraxinus pennsylvanica]
MATRCALLHMFFLLSLAVAQPSNSTNNTIPGCQSSCGNVDIPYPFGIGLNCSLNSDFNINCDTSFNPPKLSVKVGLRPSKSSRNPRKQVAFYQYFEDMSAGARKDMRAIPTSGAKISMNATIILASKQFPDL